MTPRYHAYRGLPLQTDQKGSEEGTSRTVNKSAFPIKTSGTSFLFFLLHSQTNFNSLTLHHPSLPNLTRSTPVILPIQMINMAETRKLLPKSKTDVRGFSLPQTPEELRKLLKKAGLKSIHDLDQGYLGSGSQITQKQFLALRVVCPSLAPHSKLLESLDVYGLSKVWNDAVRMVTQSREYQAYLKLVPATQPLHFDHGAPDYPGLFLLVLRFQKQTYAHRTPPRTQRMSPSEDLPKSTNQSERTISNRYEGQSRNSRADALVR